MGCWLLRLSAKILALLRLLVNFFQLRLTKKFKTNFFCFKELNVNEHGFFVALKVYTSWWKATSAPVIYTLCSM